MRGGKGMDLGRMVNGEELGAVEGGETIVRTFCMILKIHFSVTVKINKITDIFSVNY